MSAASSIFACHFLTATLFTGHQLGTGFLRRAWPQYCSKCHPSEDPDGFTFVHLRLYVFAFIGHLMGLCLCESTLYLSFLTWLAMLPCPHMFACSCTCIWLVPSRAWAPSLQLFGCILCLVHLLGLSFLVRSQIFTCVCLALLYHFAGIASFTSFGFSHLMA